MDYIDRIVCMGVMDYLRALPDESVNCIITSPPYYGKRDYQREGQIGLEPSPAEYVARLVEIFREARRVLRKDGTFWLNLGDGFAANRGHQVSQSKHQNHDYGESNAGKVPNGFKPKDLLMIPARVAIALQDDGWWLRSEICWFKPNAMPESVKDRPTVAHEMIYLLTKSSRYYYDYAAIKEPIAESTGPRMQRAVSDHHKNSEGAPGQTSHSMHQPRPNRGNRKAFRGNGQYTNQDVMDNSEGVPNEVTGNTNVPNATRNKRSVWSVPTVAGYRGKGKDHFAQFPPELIRPMVMAGCPEWGLVLDPFMGAGTTALVAWQERRHYCGCDLNADYVTMATERLNNAVWQDELF